MKIVQCEDLTESVKGVTEAEMYGGRFRDLTYQKLTSSIIKTLFTTKIQYFKMFDKELSFTGQIFANLTLK